jgi:hypothetical protein
LLLSDADGGKLLSTRQAVTAALAPKSREDALALATFLLDTGYVEPALPTSVTGNGPYIVTTHHMQRCGCSHPVARVTAVVDKDGTTRETSRTVVKQVNRGLCVD